jgi:hypothetical protein
VTYQLESGRLAYCHLARGQARVAGETLDGGDAAVIQGQPGLSIEASGSAEVLLFDLPA